MDFDKPISAFSSLSAIDAPGRVNLDRKLRTRRLKGLAMLQGFEDRPCERKGWLLHVVVHKDTVVGRTWGGGHY